MNWFLLASVLVSFIAFGAVISISNRKLGADIAWAILLCGGVLAFVANVAGHVGGLNPRQIAGFSAGLIAAGAAGMLHHFFLGRFERVGTARGLFSAVFLSFWLALGLAVRWVPE